MVKKESKSAHESESDPGFMEPEAISAESELGVIRINNEVIANIVRLAAQDVEGVYAVGGRGLRDEIAGIFTKKEGGAGIQVEEDENGDYRIGVKVILTYGIQLAKCAQDVQAAVRDQVMNMTNKRVSKIDVYIEDVKMPDPSLSPPKVEED